MDLSNPPDLYWHCRIEVPGKRRGTIVNDMTFAELMQQVVRPWRAGRPFTVAGTIVRTPNDVSEIRLVHTSEPQAVYAERHNAKMRSMQHYDGATDRRTLPFSKGEDVTFVLLFAGDQETAPIADVALVERVCSRLPQAARILAARSRKDKTPYNVSDEYDVQDLLHGVLRAYIKYSVQENPLPKVAGAKSSRADISIEELGTLIEVKYVHGPTDQKRIFEEYSQDLVLYTEWEYLQTLILLIYNSTDLRDAEAFEKLSGVQEVNGRRFTAKIILA